jgi:hypothetical protein
MKGRVTGPLEKVRTPRQMKPIGGFESIDKRLAAFSKNAAQRQATRIVRGRVGEVGTNSQALIQDALANPAEFVTKTGSSAGVTAKEAVAHIPEGAPIIALQDAVAQLDVGRPELVSARFGRRWANRETAIKEAIATRDKITAPLREKAFRDAESVREQLSTAKAGVEAIVPKGLLDSKKLLAGVEGINEVPGPRVFRAVQLTTRRVANDLKKYTREDGTINPEDLYAIRSQIGVHINKALGKKSGEKLSSVDQRLTAGIERTLQKSFDDAMPHSWKDYLETYAEHSQLIDAEKARFKASQNPLQRSAVDATEHQSLTPTTGLPVNWLSKEISAISAAMRYMGKKGSADVVTFVADMLFDPRKYAEAIKAMPATERNALLTTISKRYGPRAALSLTLTNQQTDQQNVNPSR